MAGSDLDSTLRAHGLRATAQRRHVLSAIRNLGHGTPEQVCERVQEQCPSLNLSTVYRTIELLESLGIVSHTHLGHGAPAYHEVQHADHLHLLCRRCGWIGEARSEHVRGLAGEVVTEFGFLADVGHLTLDGICSACRKDG
jgi:Fur family ferric uptake transcriptional regulator